MKKQLFLMSALALTAFGSLTSCNNKSGIKVGLICLHDNASTYDKNFIDAFKEACNKAKSKGTISEYRIIDNIPEDQQCYDAAEQLVNDGYKAVFTDSFGHDAYIHEIAKEYPDVFFSSATGIEARTSGLKNYHNAFASIYEGRYLAGVAAAQYLIENKGKTKESDVKLGYVGAKPYAEVISGYTSWYLGVTSLLPKATMQVIYTDEWYAEVKESNAAATLIKNGAELISQHADSMGAPRKCQEEGIPNVSYNVNTVEIDDLCKGTYIGHSRINWEPYYEKAIAAAAKGVNTPVEGEIEQNWTGSITTDSVQYNISDLVENKKPVLDAETAIKNGTLHVFDTTKFTVKDLTSKYPSGEAPKEGTDYVKDEGGHLTMMKADTDADYQRDTDLFKKDETGSYIQESHFRSAPSFDFIIDGITITNE